MEIWYRHADAACAAGQAWTSADDTSTCRDTLKRLTRQKKAEAGIERLLRDCEQLERKILARLMRAA